MRRSLRLTASVVGLSFALVLGACGDDDDDAADTTTTSTTAATTSTTAAATLNSTSALATALDNSIISAVEVQSVLALSATPQPFPGTAAAPPPPQGGVTLNGIAKVFPSEAYKGLLEQGGASEGANRTYLVTAGQSGYVVNVLAIKFKDAAGGGTFVNSARQVAETFGGAKTTAHDEVKLGVGPGAVIRVPPQPGSTNETVVIGVLYENGIYYQLSASAPPGAVTDETVIKLARGQDTKYQKAKSAIPAS